MGSTYNYVVLFELNELVALAVKLKADFDDYLPGLSNKHKSILLTHDVEAYLNLPVDERYLLIASAEGALKSL